MKDIINQIPNAHGCQTTPPFPHFSCLVRARKGGLSKILVIPYMNGYDSIWMEYNLTNTIDLHPHYITPEYLSMEPSCFYRLAPFRVFLWHMHDYHAVCKSETCPSI